MRAVSRGLRSQRLRRSRRCRSCGGHHMSEWRRNTSSHRSPGGMLSRPTTPSHPGSFGVRVHIGACAHYCAAKLPALVDCACQIIPARRRNFLLYGRHFIVLPERTRARSTRCCCASLTSFYASHRVPLSARAVRSTVVEVQRFTLQRSPRSHAAPGAWPRS